MLIIFFCQLCATIIACCFQFAASPRKLLTCASYNSIQQPLLTISFAHRHMCKLAHYPIHPNLNASGINAKISGTIIENPTPNAFTIFKYFLLCKPNVLNAL